VTLSWHLSMWPLSAELNVWSGDINGSGFSCSRAIVDRRFGGLISYSSIGTLPLLSLSSAHHNNNQSCDCNTCKSCTNWNSCRFVKYDKIYSNIWIYKTTLKMLIYSFSSIIIIISRQIIFIAHQMLQSISAQISSLVYPSVWNDWQHQFCVGSLFFLGFLKSALRFPDWPPW
jgi:hypothetical protein